MKIDHLIVGLGNPGPRYQFTRHNIGFLALDLIAHELRENFEKKSSLSKLMNAELCECTWADKKLLLIKPQTFMNLSGESLRALIQKHPHLKPSPEVPLIVIHDEIDIPFSKIKIKFGGSDAGHNGLKSLRQHLGHGDFFRIRLGVGKPPPESPQSVADFVLENFRREEEIPLGHQLQRSFESLHELLWKGLQAAQERAAKE